MESISISTFNTGPVAFGGFLVENKGSKQKNVPLPKVSGRGSPTPRSPPPVLFVHRERWHTPSSE